MARNFGPTRLRTSRISPANPARISIWVSVPRVVSSYRRAGDPVSTRSRSRSRTCWPRRSTATRPSVRSWHSMGLFDPVGSTSWHHRHLPVFKRLDEILRAEGPSNPQIMIVGPGGVTRAAAWLLNDANNPDASAVRKLLGDAARYSDQFLRRIPLMSLVSLEPHEVQRTVTVPHKLVVVDRSSRILASVRRDIPEATCVLNDISISPLSLQADVIIAFNVICR